MKKEPTTIKHPLFAQMRVEHEQVLSYLDDLDKCSSKQSIKDLTQNLWMLVVEKHHYKEETLLFESIYKNPKITEGGPMCGLYYGLHMIEKTRQGVEAITQQPLSIEPHQMDIINTKSPLVIPLEEHRGGKDLLAYIIKMQDQLNIDEVKKYLDLFKKGLIGHILKEENCLYHLCASLLTDDKADKIFDLWKLD